MGSSYGEEEWDCDFWFVLEKAEVLSMGSEWVWQIWIDGLIWFARVVLW
jgi:hypothetical protein